MRVSSVLFVCRTKAGRCVRSAGDKAHLIYFAMVAVTAHDAYAYAAGGCLSLGVLSMFIKDGVDAA